jgi:YD repeat-containing protein
MMISRRAGLTRVLLGGIASACFTPSRAEAQETVTYVYDALGRVVGVRYGTSSTLSYRYDAMGNRIEATTGGFAQTIAIAASNTGVNLRTLANLAGYTGAENVNATFEVNNGVLVQGNPGGAAGGHGIDTGTWPTGSYSIALTLVVTSGGIVRGGGGQGGAGGGGGGGSPAGGPGGAGGDAIYCRLPMTINFNAGSEIKGGGGGGGGAARGPNPSPPPVNVGGGGGGGGYPNGPAGPGAGVNQAQPGTTSGGGIGGGVVGGNIGASGGNAATNGGSVSGAGGVAGYCVRKNGHTVPVTNNSTNYAGTIG